MQDLIKQEQFELEVLERLNSKKLLDNLLFGGGTMLRLCFGLNRYSVDLDFCMAKPLDETEYFQRIKDYLAGFYTVRDSANKFYTLLYEIKSKDYPRCLKIEIRKELKKVKSEKAIAYSKYSNAQVLLKVITLSEMMKSKIEAFLDRKEVRDAFDMEFLLKKGVELEASSETLGRLLTGIDALTRKDYAEKLASLLEAKERQYYRTENFKILKSAIQEKLNNK
jgi:predicted nucleotidyltransferase component of viral defense system